MQQSGLFIDVLALVHTQVCLLIHGIGSIFGLYPCLAWELTSLFGAFGALMEELIEVPIRHDHGIETHVELGYR